MAKIKQQTVNVRTISGHATGTRIPAPASGNDLGSRQARALASSQPNTDRRRFVTH